MRSTDVGETAPMKGQPPRKVPSTLIQDAAINIVTGSGSQNPSMPAEIAVTHVLAGGVAGGIMMLAIGFLKSVRSNV
jgi:hypothetical protein